MFEFFGELWFNLFGVVYVVGFSVICLVVVNLIMFRRVVKIVKFDILLCGFNGKFLIFIIFSFYIFLIKSMFMKIGFFLVRDYKVVSFFLLRVCLIGVVICGLGNWFEWWVKFDKNW